MRALMLQGTGSDVGKSTLVAGLARLARRKGLSVAPFKPQNMSNNAAACADGGEIGRAQAVQARAAGLAPRTDFNPVLLKPQSDRTAQLVVHGRVVAPMDAADYMCRRGALLKPVLESFERLRAEFDLILVEGAGSPAEINLRAGDIANMGFACAADVPVCLIGDIDKGGVIASLVGTQAVLDRDDAVMIEAFIVNKFRGDPTLFEAGVEAVMDRTGWLCLGVLPWLPMVARLPAEDAVSMQAVSASNADIRKRLRIRAPMLSRMANFDDADPLRLDPGVDFAFVPPGQPIPRDADVILIFGTKSTLGDLDFLRAQGWDHDILAHVRTGGFVTGLCGGYQILGRTIEDPDGHDGKPGVRDGLGLLDVHTVLGSTKTVRCIEGRCAQSDQTVRGYEIHIGRTQGPDCDRPLLHFGGYADGARSPDERIEGTYVHGLFGDDAFRLDWISRRGGTGSDLRYEAAVETALDGLADHMDAHLDIDALLGLAR